MATLAMKKRTDWPAKLAGSDRIRNQNLSLKITRILPRTIIKFLGIIKTKHLICHLHNSYHLILLNKLIYPDNC